MGHRLNLQDATGVIATYPGKGTIIAAGTDVPADHTVGYATGCIFIHVDGGSTTALYINKGDESDCDFDAVGFA